jgi:CelD/BcsL family acetyltransferase involved in cellulose biosynthesis
VRPRVHSPPVRAELVDDVSRLESLRGDWDELARQAGKPYSAPGWLLPWWRHAAPPEARLRVVTITESGALVGIAPFFADRRGAYRALGQGAASGVEPLARTGAEPAVADAVARALAAADPRPRAVFLDGVAAGSPWAELLAASWPEAPAAVLRDRGEQAPFAERPAGGYDEWFGGRTQHFRKRMRRARRSLADDGAEFRLASAETIAADLDAFALLHRSRWAERGGSGVLTEGLERMLPEAARELGVGDRFRVWVLEEGGRTVAVELLLAAGTTSSFWLGGFDPAWSRAQPSLQTMLTAIEDAFGRGEARVELGEGGQEFKYRLADGDETLRWLVLVPPGRGHLRTRLRVRAGGARRAVSARAPTAAKRLVRRALAAR